LTATPEEIEAFLRGNAAATWKTSVGAAKRARPRPAPRPKPEPKIVLRDAKAGDAGAIAALIVALGYDVTAADVRRRLKHVCALVAEKGQLIGVVTTSVTAVLH